MFNTNNRIKRSITSVFIVFLLITIGFIGFLVFEGIIDEGGVDAATTRYVGGTGLGNYSTIQAAIDNASTGDTIRVYAGTYYENVIVNKTVTLIGNGTMNTTIDGGGGGDVVNVTANWVNITNFTISNSGSSSSDAGVKLNNVQNCCIYSNNVSSNNELGIYLNSSSGNTLMNNTCSSNVWHGIFLWYSSSNTLINNTCYSNTWYGIGLGHSASNMLMNNTCSSNNDCGIMLFSSSSNNTLMNNTCNGNGHGICLEDSSSNMFIINTCISNNKGIWLYDSSDNTIINNTCSSNNKEGIYLLDSSSNSLMNNTCSNNRLGICLEDSSSNSLMNNTCSNNYDGIMLDFSSSNSLMNNTCSNNLDGVVLAYSSRNNKLMNNTCSSNNGSGICLNSSSSNTLMSNTCSSNTWGILLAFSSSNSLMNNTCPSNNRLGIWLLYSSSSNKLMNNTCSSNNEHGILLAYSSSNNKLMNNTCSSNNIIGILLDSSSNNNKLVNNTCSNNPDGIVLASSSRNNELMNNTCSNNDYGITLASSSSNKFMNNICSLNNIIGIYLYSSSSNNEFMNNTCSSNNYHGIYLLNSPDITLMNNTCSSNNYHGIVLDSTSSNTLMNNICSNNDAGIYLYFSSSSTLMNNICSNNNDGIWLNSSSGNTLMDNTFNSNNYDGIDLDSSSKDNNIYHNNIISNGRQAVDDGNNQWGNGNGEGNYWSDYSGQDNGANDRIAGDGIGDTKIPHPGSRYDNYPFINRNGWFFPGIPILLDPGEVDSDGNYTILWEENCRTTGYILEEDESITFDSPKVIYNGSNLLFEIKDKPNGTYYYRIKAYNEKYESPWSNVENIIVEWPPDIPKNLIVSVYPPGNTLNLSWEPNIVDTKEYILEFKNESNQTWEQLEPIIHPINTFNHTNLNDGERYNYRICAQDFRQQLSDFSEIVSAVPLDSVPPAPPRGLSIISTSNNSIKLNWKPNIEADLAGYNIYKINEFNSNNPGDPIGTVSKNKKEYIDTNFDVSIKYYYIITAYDEVPNESEYSNIILGPHRPEINNSLDDFEIPEDSYDDSSINLYYWFKDINNDPLGFEFEGNKHIDVSFFQKNGTVILIPDKNWNGQETLTFSASDGVFEVSDQVTITITPVNDPPEPAEIVAPKNGIEIDDGETINFEGTCDDPDLEYGDILTFRWSSDIAGELGNGRNLEDVILPIGEHLITLKVTDSEDETSTASVHISIVEIPQSDTDGDGMPNVWERKHGLDPEDPTDADKDTDGDGKTNLEEYLAGTDPQVGKRAKEDRIGGSIYLIIAGVVIVIIVIILIFVLFMVIRKKKISTTVEKKEEKVEEEKSEMDLFSMKHVHPQKSPFLQKQFLPPQREYPEQLRQQLEYESTTQKELEEPETKSEPTDIKELLVQGSQAYGEGRYADAIIAWQHVLGKEPDKHPDIKIAIDDAMAKMNEND